MLQNSVIDLYITVVKGIILMKNGDFEKIMNTWAAHEVESAPRGKGPEKGPELRPTKEMYRMIEARKRKGLFPFLSFQFSVHARRVLVIVAAVCMVLLVIILPVIFYLSDQDYRPSIGLRKGSVPKGGIIVKHPPKRGGPKKGAISFHQLMFHYQKAGSPSVYGVDIRFPQEEKITLAADDNYRLIMQPAGDLYVYIYQLDFCGELAKLFPNSAYSSVQNPLEDGQAYHVPSEPNWFHLGEKGRDSDRLDAPAYAGVETANKGEEQIYVAASAQPIPKLEEIYAQYGKAGNREIRRESLSHLFKELDGELPGEDTAVWRFVFSHQ
jgi:hypothetical protein